MAKAGRTGSRIAIDAGRSSTDALADRLRAALPAERRSERRMFGGVCFMLNGNMIAGTFRKALLVRVGRDQHAQALTRPGARAMEMRGRSLAGYITVDQADLNDTALREWLRLALGYVRTLPSKPSGPKSKQKKKGERK